MGNILVLMLFLYIVGGLGIQGVLLFIAAVIVVIVIGILIELKSKNKGSNESFTLKKQKILNQSSFTDEHGAGHGNKPKELEKKIESKYDTQNKFIKTINDEKERLNTKIPNGAEDKQIEELKLQVKAFQSTLTDQSDKIIELQNKLIKKEEDTKDLTNKFVSKINNLEEKIAKQKITKTKIFFTAPVEKQSIKKDDGIIVKRDSFDDF